MRVTLLPVHKAGAEWRIRSSGVRAQRGLPPGGTECGWFRIHALTFPTRDEMDAISGRNVE